MIAEDQAPYQSDAGSKKDANTKGVSFVSIFEKIDRVITAAHCIS